MDDWLPSPGVGANINSNRAVISTDTTLYTPSGIRYHLSRREHCVLICVSFKEI